MSKPILKTAKKLAEMADAYFTYIDGDYHIDTNREKDQKIWDREAEPPTITGLALFLGFNCRQELEDYEHNSKSGKIIKRSRLRIEAFYEKKLHQQSPSGAIFALKNLGWKEKTEDKTIAGNIIKNIKIEIIESGIKLAENENDVVL